MSGAQGITAAGPSSAPPAPNAPAPQAAAPEDPTAAFLAQVPENIRGEAYFKDIKDVPTLALKAYHQAKLIGRDPETMVVIPGPDDAEGWARLWQKLGRPEKPEEYKFAAPQLPEGLTLDESLHQAFTAKVHELGLSQRQAEQLYQWWNEQRIGAHNAFRAQETTRQQAAIAQLRADPEFGGAAFEQNVETAQAALAHYGTPELIAELDRTGLGDHPALIKVFAKIGRELQEDGLIGRAGEGAAAMTPAEVQQQINAKRADPQFRARYYSRDRNTRQAAIAELSALYDMLAEGNAAMRGESPG